ncbi:MAG: hypothetical protein EU551_02200 [Promethearchaeota archaeon]|nr:MAG: hypothetical protein EU551_02200 [Candidatus Lokiarchaeota archaeon]
MPQLNWKTRFLIILATASIFVMSLVINQILIVSPSELNEKDPYFFNENNYYASFYFNNGSYGVEQHLTVQSTYLNNTHSNCSIKFDDIVQDYFYVHPNGLVYDDKVLTENYSFYWVFVPNLLTTLGQGLEPGTSYNITDPTGLLGQANSNYVLIIERKGVYWPYEQRFSNLLGAQASFDVTIYNKSDMVKIATATYDQTTGNIEILEGGKNKHITLLLYETNFPISRNRINQMWAAWIYGIILIVALYLLMKVDWKNKFLKRFHLNSEKRNLTTLLMIGGFTSVIIEMIDIWFYIPLGFVGNVLLHTMFTVGMGIFCYHYRYKLAWLFPAILEIMFVMAIFLVEGEPYVPHLTAFMGSTITWLVLVFISGKPSTWSEGKSKLGKFLSKFV